MKKGLIVALSFIIFFFCFSEVVSIMKAQVIDDWVVDFFMEKTGSPTGEIPSIEPKENAEDHILSEISAASQVNLISDIKYIHSRPRSRIPIITNLESYREHFSIVNAVSNNVLAFASASGYWTERVREAEISEKSRAEFEASEPYKVWRQEIREDIQTLAILEDGYFEKGSLKTPEELLYSISSYSLDEVPFFYRFFLKSWDLHTKERAQEIYDEFTHYLEEDNLEYASCDLFNLYAIKRGQVRVMESIDTFQEFHPLFVVSGIGLKSCIFFEFLMISILSAAATMLAVLVTYPMKGMISGLRRMLKQRE